MIKKNFSRKRDKALGLLELIAIALGGMIGGGIFTVLGISVSMIGVFTPIAFILGGFLALFAAYSYVKLGVYYKDEGATYSFYKKTFPQSHFAASLVGWWISFGYISTLALYAYTFASYAISGFSFADNGWIRKLVAGGIILVYTLINVWSVKGMGKIEDFMVYTKLVLLTIISLVLMMHANTTLPILLQTSGDATILSVLIVASLTFVSFEGFQLVIHAVDEMENPVKNIPRAIYSAIIIAALVYIIISLGAILAIPFENIVKNKEYALASGAKEILGQLGFDVVIMGALLATSSAISGTLFGASRLMAVIAEDGYLPTFLMKRRDNIPVYAILLMAALAFALILLGNLKVILEFGSVTFLLVSLLMAIANFKIHTHTHSSLLLTLISMIGLMVGMSLILYYEATTQREQVFFIVGIYTILTLGAWVFSSVVHRKKSEE